MKEVLVMMVIASSDHYSAGIAHSVQPKSYCEAVKAYGKSKQVGHEDFITHCIPLPVKGAKK